MEDINAFWYKKKFNLIIETERDLENVTESLYVALKHPLSNLSYLNEMIQDGCPQIFSSIYEHSKKRSVDVEADKTLPQIARDFFLHDERAVSEFLDRASGPAYSFSEKPIDFIMETAVVKELFSQIGENGDPRLDVALMKWFLHDGMMIERLEHEGKRRSDNQSAYGAMLSKRHIGYQAVYEAFYQVDWEGVKAMMPIGHLIEKYLKDREEKKPKSRRKKIYCGDYIAKDILPKDEKIKKILLQEGILKN